MSLVILHQWLSIFILSVDICDLFCRLMIHRPLLAAILSKAKDVQTQEQPVVYQFLMGLTNMYNSIQVKDRVLGE